MYENFYKFRAKPFRLSPDPRFFFNSKGHKRALAYLRYGVKQGEGFIIITGDVGTGKTMLVQTLLRSLEQENVVAAQVVTTQLQADDLLRLVAASFGLAYQRVSKATILRSLEVFFQSCVQEGKRVLLVVDEAQGLPRRAIEELRMLSNFHLSGRPLLQSFLLGQQEFRATMRSEGFEQLRQRVIAAYHLRALGEDETRAYIEHRLTTVGWEDNPAIDPEVFSRIHSFTGGVPRRVNTLCDRLLLYGCLEELRHIGVPAFEAVAQDIVGEQGSESDSGAALSVDAELPLAAAASAPPRLIGADEAAPEQNPGSDRLAAVESSVTLLADAVREELGLLRKALVDRSDENDKQT